uniref:Uncharacterized protein n=1 Tax=Oryza barthii TaxID=65489 RepID=A0A0D3H155_9ORYZ
MKKKGDGNARRERGPSAQHPLRKFLARTRTRRGNEGEQPYFMSPRSIARSSMKHDAQWRQGDIGLVSVVRWGCMRERKS